MSSFMNLWQDCGVVRTALDLREKPGRFRCIFKQSRVKHFPRWVCKKRTGCPGFVSSGGKFDDPSRGNVFSFYGMVLIS